MRQDRNCTSRHSALLEVPRHIKVDAPAWLLKHLQWWLSGMILDRSKSHGFVPSDATRLFRLTLLAPDIVAALLGGRQPPELTARKLMDDTRLPLNWNEQRRTLGFVQPLDSYGSYAPIAWRL